MQNLLRTFIFLFWTGNAPFGKIVSIPTKLSDIFVEVVYNLIMLSFCFGKLVKISESAITL